MKLNRSQSTHPLPFNFFAWVVNQKIPLLILTVLTLSVYFNSFTNEYTSDDIAAILRNPAIGDIRPVLSQGLSFFRPLLYFLIANTTGKEPFFFRSLNIFFHIGSVILLYLLLCLLAKRSTALLTSVLFAVHPILVESVTWISGGTYSQYTFFLLASLITYILSYHKKMHGIFSLVLFFLAVSSSEKAIIFPFILVLYETALGNIRNNWKKTLPYFGIALVFGIAFIPRFNARLETVLSLFRLHSSASQPGRSDFFVIPTSASAFKNVFFLIPIAISTYLQLIVWPSALSLYQSEFNFTTLQFMLRVFVLIAFLGAVWYSYWKNKHIFFWLSLFVVALTPTLTPLGISWIVAERYAYFASIGILAAFSIFITQFRFNELARRSLYVFLSLIILALATRTIVRNADWKNEDTLWIATGKTAPSHPETHNNLGDVYGRQGDLKRSIQEFQIAIRLRPLYPEAHHNLGNAYLSAGNVEEALKEYQKAMEISPSLWQAYTNIAQVYFDQKKYQQAEAMIQKGIRANPAVSNLQSALGIFYFIAYKDVKKAREHALQALKLDPYDEQGRQLLQKLSQP